MPASENSFLIISLFQILPVKLINFLTVYSLSLHHLSAIRVCVEQVSTVYVWGVSGDHFFTFAIPGDEWEDNVNQVFLENDTLNLWWIC